MTTPSRLRVKVGAVEVPGAAALPETVADLINSHAVNQSVALVLPQAAETKEAPEEQKAGWYYDVTLPLTSMLEPAFLDAYVRKGSLTALAAGAALDGPSALALAGGHLVIRLHEDVFTRFGIPGTASKVDPGTYIIDIDVAATSFRPGKRLYARLHAALDRCASVRLFVTWTPAGDAAPGVIEFGSSATRCVQKPLTFGTRTYARLRRPRITTELLDGWGVNAMADKDAFRAQVQDISEWLGAALCGCTAYLSERGLPPHLCGQTPLDIIPNEFASLAVSKCEGLIHHTTIASQVSTLQQRVIAGELPWAIVAVHGFQDSPISWTKPGKAPVHDRSLLVSADHHYVIIISPRRWCCIQALGAHDVSAQ